MLQEKLIEKSKEAFAMAIEIYNKPTIRYRVEGFSFFICNAWELMLKAHMINKFGEDSIYYKDNRDRTITLENCMQKIFTNEKAPLRRNLAKIIELRNTNTHFVTEEYEMIYIPLFQACVLNFVEKMKEFHNVDMTEVIPQNFLTLAVSMKALDESVIRAKYPDEDNKPYALREWENFKIAPEKTSTTILMTTAVRLDPFNIEQIRNLQVQIILILILFQNKEICYL